jgi:Domain of unknown function (DUF4440)
MQGIRLFLPVFAMFVMLSNAQEGSTAGTSDELFRTVASLDDAVFDAYNRCDLDKFGTFFTDDLEFYHDRTGLTRSRQSTIEALKKNICGKVRREIIPGTLQVYPIRGYGALQMGTHRFCDPKSGKCGEGSGTAKFIHLWQNKDGEWKITRVISYDH